MVKRYNLQTVLSLFIRIMILSALLIKTVKPATSELNKLKEQLQKLGQSLQILRSSLQSLLVQIEKKAASSSSGQSPNSEKNNQHNFSLDDGTIFTPEEIKTMINSAEGRNKIITELFEKKETKKLLQLFSTPYDKIIETESKKPLPASETSKSTRATKKPATKSPETTQQAVVEKKIIQEPLVFFLIDQKDYDLFTRIIELFSEQDMSKLIALKNAESITLFNLITEKYLLHERNFDNYSIRESAGKLVISLIKKLSVTEVAQLEINDLKNLTTKYSIKEAFADRISSIFISSVTPLEVTFLDKILLYIKEDQNFISYISQGIITYFLNNSSVFEQANNKINSDLFNTIVKYLESNADYNQATVAFANLLVKLSSINAMEKTLIDTLKQLSSNKIMSFIITKKFNTRNNLSSFISQDILSTDSFSEQKAILIQDLRGALYSNFYNASDEKVVVLLELLDGEKIETLFCSEQEEQSQYCILLTAKNYPQALTYFLKNYLFMSASHDSNFFLKNKQQLLNYLRVDNYKEAKKYLDRYKDKEFLLHQDEDFSLSSLSEALHNIFSLNEESLSGTEKLEISELKKAFSLLLSSGLEKRTLLIGNIFLGSLGINRQGSGPMSTKALSPYAPTVSAILLDLINQKNKKIDELPYLSVYDTYNNLPYTQETRKHAEESKLKNSYLYEEKNFLHMLLLLPILYGEYKGKDLKYIDTYEPGYKEGIDQQIVLEILTLIHDNYTQNIQNCSALDYQGRSVLDCALEADIGENALQVLCFIIQKNIAPSSSDHHPIFSPNSFSKPSLYEKTNMISEALPYTSIEYGGQFDQEVEGYRNDKNEKIKGYHRHYSARKPNLYYKKLLKKFILEEIDRLGWKSDTQKISLLKDQVKNAIEFHEKNPKKSSEELKKFDQNFLNELEKI